MDWIASDDELWDDVIELQNTADAAMFGRVNFQGFEDYWRSGAANQASSKHETEHAQWLDQATKIVFSRTLEKVDWKHTLLIKDHIAEEVAKLKQQPGKNIILFGGAGIASTLMKQGLIDEYHINVNPVVLGRGKPLFKDLKDKISLKLIKSKVFKSGVVALQYASDNDNRS
jgi:dihydrofolate reductase